MPRDRAGNSRANARKINFKSGKGTLRDWVGQADTEDFYSFRVKSSSKVKLKLKGLKANADLEFLDRRGNVIASSSRLGRRREKVKLNNLDAGKYFVRVHQKQGNTQYKLRFVSKSRPDSNPIDDTSINNDGANPFIQEVLALTNQERAGAGLQPLTLNLRLIRAAQGHSESMAVDDFFGHTGADGSTMAERVSSEGYVYRFAAENVGAGYSSPAAVVEGWMNSPGHRANILSSNPTELGIGYYYLANDTGSINYNHYWTQVFGAPLS